MSFRAAVPVSNATRKLGEASIPVATREYRDGRKALRVKITDTSQAASIRQQFTEQLLQVGNEVAGNQRGVVLGGAPAVQSFYPKRRTSRAVLLVGARYLIEIEVDDTAAADDAAKVAQALNLQPLSGKSAGK